jgi:poly-beta-1,6-N-acetyl-D-glucosamine synthase
MTVEMAISGTATSPREASFGWEPGEWTGLRSSAASWSSGPSIAAGPQPFKLSVVVCAYNEEQNLPHLLRALTTSTGPSFDLREILCVASGCTDRTVEVIATWHRIDPRVRLLVQPVRLGKAAALAEGLRAARGDVILIQNADTLPAPGALEHLVGEFADPKVNLACTRLVPTSSRGSFAETLGIVLWELHDHISRISPKAGEAFAIRRLPVDLPSDIEDDDTFVGIQAASGEADSRYARDAVVYNRVPGTLPELLLQRYRINRQVFSLWRRTGLLTSTWAPGCLGPALLSYLRDRPRRAPLVATLALLEAFVRTFALARTLFQRRPLRSWVPVASTKVALEAGAAGRLPTTPAVGRYSGGK